MRPYRGITKEGKYKCDDGQIEVGLEDSRYTTIEIIGNIHEESK